MKYIKTYEIKKQFVVDREKQLSDFVRIMNKFKTVIHQILTTVNIDTKDLKFKMVKLTDSEKIYRLKLEITGNIFEFVILIRTLDIRIKLVDDCDKELDQELKKLTAFFDSTAITKIPAKGMWDSSEWVFDRKTFLDDLDMFQNAVQYNL